MKQELYGTRLHVNCSYLEHNINFLKRITPRITIIAMVKANAYGHGDIFMTQKMEKFGINYFGVADFEEGVKLRKNGITSPIMVMNPGDKNISTIIENNLEPVIYNNSILSSLINTFKLNKQKNTPVHIKVNTGMNRWGFMLSEIPDLIVELKKINNIRIQSVYSHLASAENEIDDSFTRDQIMTLKKIQTLFNKNFNYEIKAHILNSSALLRNFTLDNAFNYVRVGLLLYGAP